jgi:predicted ATP-grasp superfamily ATP-dependent carboligase
VTDGSLRPPPRAPTDGLSDRWRLPARVAVLELVVGGGWSRVDPLGPPDAGLLEEACSMLGEIIDELMQADGTEVHTCLATDLPRLNRLAAGWSGRPQMRLVRVADGDDWLAAWRGIASQVDWCLVIAPELGGALEQTLDELATCAPNLLNCRSQALRLGCDKWAWSRWLMDHSWSQPQCFRWPEVPPLPPAASGLERSGRRLEPAGSAAWDWVVKRPDGAGGLGLKRFHNWSAAIEHAARCHSPENPPLIQAWLSGEAGSVVGFFDPVRNGRAIWLCPVRQRLEETSDGGLRYLGGQGPWRGRFEASLRRFQSDLSRTPPSGLCGWCGFDFVVPRESPDQIIPIELNPRLTSSFGLYRRLYGRGFLAQLLNGSGEPSSPDHSPGATSPTARSTAAEHLAVVPTAAGLQRLAGTADAWCWPVDANPICWPAVD